ncbi:concanavalin A-like lectin/glucanase domain-containing protein [Geopyxis carbonaria]|nr:concanavalin A-like lectin/glucanase domain-containing protein [Geopyxis carbonaria]
MAMAALLLLALALGAPATHAANSSGSADCDCYATSAQTYYTHYSLHDFRHLSAPPAPALRQALPAGANFTSGQSSDTVGTTQRGYLDSADWTQSWAVQEWGKDRSDVAPTRMWNSNSNVYVAGATDDGGSSMLVLRTKRWGAYQASAEVENLQKNLMYASIRFRARVVGDSGAVAGMFLYRNGANESDIEILTRDNPDEIRYSNQPVLDDDGNEIKDASTTVNMNTDAQIDGTVSLDKRDQIKWSDWHTHRLDWTANATTWYVDGRQLHSKTYGVPTVSSYVVLNMWSDGGEWSGKMDDGGEARLELGWVEMVYNTSGPIDDGDDGGPQKLRRRDGGGCKTVCNVDGSGSIKNGGFKVVSAGAAAAAVPVGLLAAVMVAAGCLLL